MFEDGSSQQHLECQLQETTRNMNMPTQLIRYDEIFGPGSSQTVTAVTDTDFWMILSL